LIWSNGFAQSSNEIFDVFKGQEDVTTVSISKYMFSLFSDVETEDAESQEFLDVVKTLDAMKIITTENDLMSKKLLKMVNTYLKKNDFKELMSIEEKDQEVIFSIKESGKKVTELIMLVNENNQNIVYMSIVGDIDLKKISKLSKKMNIQGLENLDEIDNK
jgi:hypothetical protein